PALEGGVQAAGAPLAIVGVIIAAIVLLPETAAAIRAAARRQLQASINLALGSAVAHRALRAGGCSRIVLDWAAARAGNTRRRERADGPWFRRRHHHLRHRTDEPAVRHHPLVAAGNLSLHRLRTLSSINRDC